MTTDNKTQQRQVGIGRRTVLRASAGAAVLYVLPGAVGTARADSHTASAIGDGESVTLYAGKHTDVGTVTVDHVPGTPDTLTVTYQATNPWLITETHLHVADDVAGIPHTRRGSPIPGQFDYTGTYDPARGQVVVEGIEVPDSDDGHLAIAAHAVVVGCGSAFDEFAAGDSVEGPDALVEGMTVSAVNGTAKYVVGDTPGMYGAPNGPSSEINGCLDVDGGFGDPVAKASGDPQDVDFTFDSPVSSFSLRMLDFGDYNPTRVTSVRAVVTAYDGDDNVVDTHELSYTCDGKVNPRSSATVGDLYDTGDACDADPGEPGNWTWHVEGEGIVRVELRFESGHDPNIVFDTLCVRSGGERSETAWGDGDRFVGKGNWATYFEFEL